MTRARLTKRIPLTQGQFAIVDASEYARVAVWHWILLKQSYRKTNRSVSKYYAFRWARAHDGKLVRVFLHHEILGRKVRIDHRDGNGLNNMRHNLRVATGSQNNCNREKSPGCSSRYKGVCWHKQHGTWMALIGSGPVGADGRRRRVYLGYFDEEKDAARAYDAAALRHFGEFALLNFPQSQEATMRTLLEEDVYEETPAKV